MLFYWSVHISVRSFVSKLPIQAHPSLSHQISHLIHSQTTNRSIQCLPVATGPHSWLHMLLVVGTRIEPQILRFLLQNWGQDRTQSHPLKGVFLQIPILKPLHGGKYHVIVSKDHLRYLSLLSESLEIQRAPSSPVPRWRCTCPSLPIVPVICFLLRYPFIP